MSLYKLEWIYLKQNSLEFNMCLVVENFSLSSDARDCFIRCQVPLEKALQHLRNCAAPLLDDVKLN